jgi:hypothetical protein
VGVFDILKTYVHKAGGCNILRINGSFLCTLVRANTFRRRRYALLFQGPKANLLTAIMYDMAPTRPSTCS